MLFSSPVYFIFLTIVLTLLAIFKSNQAKKGILLFASFGFYTYWDWRFVFLMAAMTLVNYAIGNRVLASENHVSSRQWVIAAVVFNLSVLGIFKYFNFFVDSANRLLQACSISIPTVEIILPVGISFITFEVMSYIIDLHRRTSPPAKSIWDLALLVAFFPHLIAGPILKPSQFLPQLEEDIRIRWTNIEPGFQIFLVGLVKKVVFADNFAAFADPIFNQPALYSADTVWLGVLAYTLQIYCDFSGYSDMAIGSARMMGFKIPRNFNLPYLSVSITEFWSRWHISLSTWLKEYVYTPLGGNRQSRLHQHANLLITMLLCGLWHGASWNFVFLGGLHGAALIVHKMYSTLTSRVPLLKSSWFAPLYWTFTFTFVCFAWVFFRSADFETGWLIISKMLAFSNSEGITWHATALWWAIPALICFHLLAQKFGEYRPFKLGTLRGAFVVSFLLLAALFLSPSATSPFIYFQF